MAEYYLIAQLPSLDGLSENSPVPIADEEFLELCRQFLSKKAMAEIEKITLSPSLNFDKSSSALINAWNENERNFRVALAKERAEKMNKTLDFDGGAVPIEVARVASSAVEIENPLEAEKFLLDYRLKFLEELRPIDSFSNDFIAYYAVKLKLLLRIRKFDEAKGKEEYARIYNSILQGEGLEAIR